MDRYVARITANGNTRRERTINNFKRSMKHNYTDSPSLKYVKVNNNEQYIFINSGSKPYLKTYHTLPDESIHAGDLVEWMDSFWLVLNADSDNELYIDGNLQQCNYILKWQDKTGKIIESPCVKLGANLGTEGNKVIITGSSKATIYLPCNEDTLKLERGHRFFIDNNKSNPIPFAMELPDNTTNVFNGHGYISLSLTEDQKVEDDNVELGICNYKTINTPTHPTISYAKIEYKNSNIKSGYSKGSTYTAKFYDELDNVFENMSPVWDIVCDFTDELNISKTDNKINISISNDKLIGRRLKLVLKDVDGTCKEDSIVLDIVGVF